MKYTWNDLVNDVNKMEDWQKNTQVYLQNDDESYFREITEISMVDEDVYINIDNIEDGASLKELEEILGDEFKREDYRLCTPIGTPFL